MRIYNFEKEAIKQIDIMRDYRTVTNYISQSKKNTLCDILERTLAWQYKNPDKVKKYKKKWNKGNVEKIKEKQARNYLKHKE